MSCVVIVVIDCCFHGMCFAVVVSFLYAQLSPTVRPT
jgi:hypothetical protein